jgi:hypothetical protein
MAERRPSVRAVRVLPAVLVTLTTVMTCVVAAQDRPPPVVEATAGWVGFADDGIVSETLVGAAGRVYVSPRISLGPESAYIDGQNHSHLVVTGNLTWDARSPVNGRPRAITPFVVAGGGVFRTREQFVTGTFSSTEGAFTAGGGVRALVGNRVTVGVETRIGWETHLRVNGLVGVQLGQ